MCLEGVTYTAIGSRGGGEEGDVYAIRNTAGKSFALKVYVANPREAQDSDVLALHKADKSREFITVPLVVNREYGYTIYQLLDIPYLLRQDPKKLAIFKAAMHRALAEDGLGIGDSHPGNYMYDKQRRLWRIDLSYLHEL